MSCKAARISILIIEFIICATNMGKIAVYNSSAFLRGFCKQTKTNPKYKQTQNTNPKYQKNPKY